MPPCDFFKFFIIIIFLLVSARRLLWQDCCGFIFPTSLHWSRHQVGHFSPQLYDYLQLKLKFLFHSMPDFGLIHFLHESKTAQLLPLLVVGWLTS